jgi:aspartyl-tRNA(Asn)/glutamyl-tRNA(Gln) amidotransferase subunit A
MYAEPHSVLDLARALNTGATTSEAVTARCLATIAELDPAINSFITVLADQALAAARDADRERAAGRDRGPLHGVPIAVKDIIDCRGVATTAASALRRGHVAAADATVIARVREAGAIVVGKTNLHEFALGTTNEDSAYGAVHQPLVRSRSPGGSSGGSAASVLAGMAYASLGTDTGGSIRIPSAACGLVGLKPTFGEIPIDGVVPLSATLDHVGPIARTVGDARVLYDVLRGSSPASSPAAVRPARGVRLGVLRNYFLELLDPQVASAFDTACMRLRDAGVVLEDVSIAHAADIAPVYLHIGLAEAASWHAQTLERRPDDYTTNVRLRLEMGRYILAEDYLRALRGRDLMRDEVDHALEDLDALLLPTLAVPATKLGAATVRVGGTEEPVRNITLRLTQLFNVTGHPAISVPCGQTGERLPVGAQLAGRLHDTAGLLDIAEALEPHLTPPAGC